MPDNAKTDEVESTVGPRGLGDNDVDDARRHRTECCDARQLLSETLRLRRAAQQQRAAAGNAGTPATAPTAAASGPRCSAAATTTTTLKRRKKPRVDRDSAMDQPQPRIRRIMFHEYKGPSDDDSETVTIAGPISTAQLPSSTSLCFPSPGMMMTAFCPKAATSIWKEIKVEQAQGGNISQLSVSPSTTDFGAFRPTSSLPRFAELQRSLRSPIYRQDFSELTSPNHLQLVQTSQLEAVSCVSGGPGAPPCQRSSLVDAQFCRLTSTTSMTSDHVVTSPALSPLSVEQSTSYSLSQRCQLPSLTSPIDVTSRSLTSGVVDHIVACFPSSATANRPKNGTQKSVTAKLLESPQAVKMDNLTVTRLRSECRLRRLPVSGRKRNLVLRLLPFADAILNGNRNTASNEMASATCCSVTGVTHALAAPITQPVESAAAEVEFHRPFVPLDSFVSSWNNFDDDDWTMEEGAALDAQSAGMTNELEHAIPLVVGSPITDNPLSSIINHVDVLADSDADKTVDASGRPPLSDDGTPSTDENETLVLRWLRQQRLIDDLRRELCRYRRALAAAQLQTLAKTSNDRGDAPSSLHSDHVTDDEIHRYQQSPPYFTTKRNSGSDGAEESPNSDAQLTDENIADDETSDETFHVSSNASTSGDVARLRDPPNYYEAVQYLRQDRKSSEYSKSSTLSIDLSCFAQPFNTGFCSIDDVIDVLANCGEL